MSNPTAVITTAHGRITIELYPHSAPNTTAAFIYAAQSGMYNSRLIKRVVPGFVLQPSYHFFDDEKCDYMLEGEFSANGFDNGIKMEKGTVAMAGDGEKYAHGTEFFIVLSDEAGGKLQGKFAAFGKVTGGYEEVERLENLPLLPVKIEGIDAVINQPVNDEYILSVTVDTRGETFAMPKIIK